MQSIRVSLETPQDNKWSCTIEVARRTYLPSCYIRLNIVLVSRKIDSSKDGKDMSQIQILGALPPLLLRKRATFSAGDHMMQELVGIVEGMFRLIAGPSTVDNAVVQPRGQVLSRDAEIVARQG